MYATLDDLRSHLSDAATPQQSAAYAEKMLHDVPEAESIDRSAFILKRCTGQVVLDIGASGKLHGEILKVATKVYGIDREESDGVLGLDLDNVDERLPKHKDVTVVVCAETLEHLANPGWFLQRLRLIYKVPLIITVPNAFSAIGTRSLSKGVEQVNREHVAYYSYKTLLELVTRFGYEVVEFYWYNGKPFFAEGLIFVCR